MAEQCGACGAALVGSEKFCGACGAPVVAISERKKPTQPQKPTSSEGENKPTALRAEEAPLKEIAIYGMILSVSAFAADLISAANSEYMSYYVSYPVPLAASPGTFELFYKLGPMIAMVFLSTLFAAFGAAIFLRGRGVAPRHPLRFIAAGLVSGIVTITMVLLFVNDFHYVVPRLPDDIVPLGLAALVAGFSVEICFRALSMGRNRK